MLDQLTTTQHMRTIKTKKVSWIDIDKPDSEDIVFLKKYFDFDPIILKEYLKRNKQTKIEKHKNYLFLILYFPIFDRQAKKAHPAEIDFFITKDRIVTGHYDEIMPFEDLIQRLALSNSLKKQYLLSSSHLLLNLINLLFDACQPMLDHIQSNIEKIDVFFTAPGYIRVQPEYLKKNSTLSFANIFDLVGIGEINKDINSFSLPYDPIVHWYIHKSKLKELIEVTKLYSVIFNEGADFIYSNSLTFDFTWFGFPFVKSMVSNMKLNGVPYEEWSEYIHLAAPSLIAKFLPKASKITFGFLDFIPKDKFGRNLINGLEDESTYFRSYLLAAHGLIEQMTN